MIKYSGQVQLNVGTMIPELTRNFPPGLPDSIVTASIIHSVARPDSASGFRTRPRRARGYYHKRDITEYMTHDPLMEYLRIEAYGIICHSNPSSLTHHLHNAKWHLMIFRS